MKERVILHSDLNNFYASVECLYHPEYRGKPLAVQKGIMLCDTELSNLNPKNDHIIHPMSFFS